MSNRNANINSIILALHENVDQTSFGVKNNVQNAPIHAGERQTIFRGYLKYPDFSTRAGYARLHLKGCR